MISITATPDVKLESVNLRTSGVLRRKLDNILGALFDLGEQIRRCHNKRFIDILGQSTIDEILIALRIADCNSGLLIGSVIGGRVLQYYKKAKEDWNIDKLSIISILLEEPTRASHKEILRPRGNSIYSDNARESRKFRIRLTAVTQLTSVIPRAIPADINTKIILSNELAIETDSIIQSTSQDQSSDDRNIASLDKGEAIVSSNLTRFAIPIKPLFEDIVANSVSKNSFFKVGGIS